MIENHEDHATTTTTTRGIVTETSPIAQVTADTVTADTVTDDTTFTNDDGEFVKITSVQGGVAFKAVGENGEQVYHMVKDTSAN